MCRWPLTRRNCRAASIIPAAHHRIAMRPSCQCLTFLACSRQIEIIDSIALVERSVRARVGGRSNARTVRVSARPSRRLAAADGWVLSRSRASGPARAVSVIFTNRRETADLSGLDLVAFMVDGVHFAESCCVVALGIDIDGVKHPLALVEGSTENTTLVTELCVGLRERGLDVTRPILAVLDGSKALHRAVVDVFDHPVMARCQLHKIRNVRDHLPERMRGPAEQRMRAAYRADSALDAQA